MLYLAVAAAGALGAPARYLLDTAIQGRTASTFPFGTMTINVTGSLLLGLLTGLGLYHAFPHTPQVVIGTGFCGGYTTFSTYTFETVRLAETGERARSVVNVGATLVAGTLAAAAGLAIAAAA